jgi:hypothetical protein
VYAQPRSDPGAEPPLQLASKRPRPAAAMANQFAAGMLTRAGRGGARGRSLRLAGLGAERLSRKKIIKNKYLSD